MTTATSVESSDHEKVPALQTPVDAFDIVASVLDETSPAPEYQNFSDMQEDLTGADTGAIKSLVGYLADIKASSGVRRRAWSLLASTQRLAKVSAERAALEDMFKGSSAEPTLF